MNLKDKEKLIEQFYGLVISIAKQIKFKFSHDIELDDLVQYGIVGLLDASERFDSKRGTQFTTYAYYWIKGAIFDGLKKMGIIKNHDAELQLDDVFTKISGTFSEEQFNKQKTLDTKVEDSLESMQMYVSDLLVGSFILTSGNTHLQDKVEAEEIHSLIINLINELPKAEKEILTGLYIKHLSLTEICTAIGIKKSWGSKLHASAIRKIKRELIKIGILNF